MQSSGEQRDTWTSADDYHSLLLLNVAKFEDIFQEEGLKQNCGGTKIVMEYIKIDTVNKNAEDLGTNRHKESMVRPP